MTSVLTQPIFCTAEANSLVLSYTVAILGGDLNVRDAFAAVQRAIYRPGSDSDPSIDECHQICQRIAMAVADEHRSRSNV